MRKIIASVLAVAMLVSNLVLPASAITAAQFNLSANAVSVDGQSDQTVNVVLSATEAMSIIALEGSFSVKGKNSEGTETDNISLTNYVSPITLSGMNYFNVSVGAVVYADADMEGYSVSAAGNVMTAVYTVDKDTPTGTYTVEFKGINIQDYYFDQVENVTYTATINVTNTAEGGSSAAGDYAASLSAASTVVAKGDQITVKVGANNDFNSAEIVVAFDTAYLTYVGASTTSQDERAPGFVADAQNGTVTIRDYGATITAAEDIYSLTFEAVKSGQTNVVITYAAFSTAAEAVKEDLVEGAGDTLEISVPYTVTVNGTAVGSVNPGANYEYTIANYDTNNNTYAVTVTVGGQAITTPEIDENGCFTVTGINGDLVINYTITAKDHDVNWVDESNAVADNEQVATVKHGTDIVFNLPVNNIPAAGSTVDGYKYVVTVYETADENTTIATSVVTGESGQTYTVPGTAINAPITIKVVKETVAADSVTVTLTEGTDLTFMVNDETVTSPATVEKGTDVVLVLTPEAGYSYVVEVDGETVTLTLTENKYTYTITNIEKSIEVTVTKTLVVSDVKVERYLSLDGVSMWLVTVAGNNGERFAGKTYTYDGAEMFWSTKYNAYCYLVVAESLDADTAKEQIGDVLVNGGQNIGSTMDVNETGTLDMNDAQLVYNMYATKSYSDFETVTMEKFLKADVNGEVGINVNDAVAIVTAILDASAGQ